MSAGPTRGGFITFEGGEGAGKSTQVQRLADRLVATGLSVETTREPGGTPKAEAIRSVILSGALAPFGADAEALAFFAARLDHLDARIRPALARGAFVVCDRFADSTRAYQGAQGRLDPGLLKALERIVVGATRPDLTLILDVPAEVGLERARLRRGQGAAADRFERESLEFHEALRSAFQRIAAEEPDRCVLVDAAAPPDAVAEAIWSAVGRRWPVLAASGEALAEPLSPRE